MKLATLNNDTRDGALLVVSHDMSHAVKPSDVADHLPQTAQALMDSWSEYSDELETIYAQLNRGEVDQAFEVDPLQLHSLLPRAYAWIDGSAYINHIVLVRNARGAEPPATLKTDPLVYQGGSDTFLAPRAPMLPMAVIGLAMRHHA